MRSLLKILIVVGDPPVTGYINTLCQRLISSYNLSEVDVIEMRVFELNPRIACRYDLLLCSYVRLIDIKVLDPILRPVIWDFTGLDLVELNHKEAIGEFHRLLRIASSFTGLNNDLCNLIEDRLGVGLSIQPLEVSVCCALRRLCVVLGEGLGNMLAGGPLIRYLAQVYGTKIDIIICNGIKEGVSLFARSKHVNAVYPGFGYHASMPFDIIIYTHTAGHRRSSCRARKVICLDREVDYNIEGRFLHESLLYFARLNEKLGIHPPFVLSHIPSQFVRDIEYIAPRSKSIGLAQPSKAGGWQKRAWPKMNDLVDNLNQRGWNCTSFGLEGEYIDNTIDFTGKPFRSVLDQIACCDIFISSDGGLCHIAEAIGVPTIWLFGPTGDVKNGPIYEHSSVISARLDCSPCLYQENWLKCHNNECMIRIEVEEVVSRIEKTYQITDAEDLNQKHKSDIYSSLEHEYKTLSRHTREIIVSNARLIKFDTGMAWIDYKLILLYHCNDLLSLTRCLGSIEHEQANKDIVAGLSILARQSLSDGLFRITAKCGSVLEALLITIFKLDGFEKDIALGTLYFKVVILLAQNNDTERCISLLKLAAQKKSVFSIVDNVRLAYVLECYLGRLDLDHVTTLFNGNNDPKAKRMAKCLENGVMNAIKDYSLREADYGIFTDEEWYQGKLAPGLAKLEVFSPVNISKALAFDGSERRNIQTGDNVILISSNFQLSDVKVGSVTSLLRYHIKVLCKHGLRPIVLTYGFDNIPEVILYKSYALCIQSHIRWGLSSWKDLFHYIEPVAIFAYNLNEKLLDLRQLSNIKPYILATIGLNERYAFNPPLDIEHNHFSQDIQDELDAINTTNQLSLSGIGLRENDHSAARKKNSKDAIMVVTSIHDIEFATCIINSLPQIRFHVFSYAMITTSLGNAVTHDLSEITLLEQLDCQICIQLSTRTSVISSEIIKQIGERKKCVVNTVDSGIFDEFSNLYIVENGSQISSWINAILMCDVSLYAD